MASDAIYERLTGILRDVFDDDAITARPDLTAADVPDWDSLAHLRVMFNVEKAFGDLATADSEFATWFRGQVKDITGFDLGAPPEGPLPDVLVDWSA